MAPRPRRAHLILLLATSHPKIAARFRQGAHAVSTADTRVSRSTREELQLNSPTSPRDFWSCVLTPRRRRSDCRIAALSSKNNKRASCHHADGSWISIRPKRRGKDPTGLKPCRAGLVPPRLYSRSTVVRQQWKPGEIELVNDRCLSPAVQDGGHGAERLRGGGAFHGRECHWSGRCPAVRGRAGGADEHPV